MRGSEVLSMGLSPPGPSQTPCAHCPISVPQRLDPRYSDKDTEPRQAC